MEDRGDTDIASVCLVIKIATLPLFKKYSSSQGGFFLTAGADAKLLNSGQMSFSDYPTVVQAYLIVAHTVR